MFRNAQPLQEKLYLKHGQSEALQEQLLKNSWNARMKWFQTSAMGGGGKDKDL